MFDKQKVLETILQECPVLSNRKGETVSGGEKRVIYAYYFNRGIRDPDLYYDRIKEPIKTTPGSTLCEIYSFWAGGPDAQKLIQQLVREGEIKPDEVLYQGPYVNNSFLDEEVIKNVRRGYDFSFHHSALIFKDHFNRICKDFGYKLQIADEYNTTTKKSSFFLERNGKKVLLGINLIREDPTLLQVLDEIQRAYQNLETIQAPSLTIS